MKNLNLLFLAIILSALIACEKKTNTTADIEANKQLTEKWDEALNKGDEEALKAFLLHGTTKPFQRR